MKDTQDKANQDWECVLTASDLVQMQIARGLLDSEGIECYVQGEQHRSMLGILGPYIEPRLMVRGADLDRAEEILSDMYEAQEHPDEVHYLCEVDGSRQELKDLDNLVLDLQALTLCTIGRDTARSTIVAQLGEPEETGADPDVLPYPELGARFTLENDRLAGFLAVFEKHPRYPELDPYPGFWDPGSTLRAPRLRDLIAFYGKDIERLSSGHLSRYEWETEDAVIAVDADSAGKIFAYRVEFL